MFPFLIVFLLLMLFRPIRIIAGIGFLILTVVFVYSCSQVSPDEAAREAAALSDMRPKPAAQDIPDAAPPAVVAAPVGAPMIAAAPPAPRVFHPLGGAIGCIDPMAIVALEQVPDYRVADRNWVRTISQKGQCYSGAPDQTWAMVSREADRALLHQMRTDGAPGVSLWFRVVDVTE